MTRSMLFNPGQVVMTPGAEDVLNEDGIRPGWLVQRHITGDYGKFGLHEDVVLTEREMQRGALETADDGKLNVWGVENWGRIISVYPTRKGEVWVLTEQDRSVTTVLLPKEY